VHATDGSSALAGLGCQSDSPARSPESRPEAVEPPLGSYEEEAMGCRVVPVAGVRGGAYICSPRAEAGRRLPLHVFGHGDVMLPGLYTSLMKQIASFGFVVVAYRSCLFSLPGLGVSECIGGQASFLEALKLIHAFSENPDLDPEAAPVDMTQQVTISGHSTGGRVAFMVAAVKDSPTYLQGTQFAEQLDKNDGALRKAADKVGAAIALHPDPMDDPGFNPDVPGFHGAIHSTPTFVVISVNDVLLPTDCSWKDFLAVMPPNKIYVDVVAKWQVPFFGGHFEPNFYHGSGPFVALFGQAFSQGNATAKELLYGDCPRCMRNVLPFARPSQRNTGNGDVGLLLCGESGGSTWPMEHAAYCNRTSS